MNIVHYLGDATRPYGDGQKIIVHCCNNHGIWGKGFVLAISARWPQVEAEYRKWWYASKLMPLGTVQFVSVEPDIQVANLIGQRGIRSSTNQHPIDYPAIATGLSAVAVQARGYKATIHMPRIGCGLAGGDWDTVKYIIEDKLKNIDVFVYDLSTKQ